MKKQKSGKNLTKREDQILTQILNGKKIIFIPFVTQESAIGWEIAAKNRLRQSGLV